MSVLDELFARLYDRALAPTEHAGLADMRAQLLAPLTGTVVEIGAGTGLNLAHYPPAVERIVACEPERLMADRLRERAASGGESRVEVVEAPGEALPLDDASADHAVSTLVLCTVDDVDRTVAELARVVRPGGTLAVIEHVASQHTGWHRVQRLIEPAWKVVARGCRLTRDPLEALARHGFDTAGIAPWQVPSAPPVVSPALVGRLVRRT